MAGYVSFLVGFQDEEDSSMSDFAGAWYARRCDEGVDVVTDRSGRVWGLYPAVSDSGYVSAISAVRA